MKKVAIFGSK